MDYATHNEQTELSINGTCLQGYVVTDYVTLLELFGRPMPGDGWKTDAEWIVKFNDGTLATLYNWKNGHAYNGDDECFDLRYIKEWNIGGTSRRSAELIQQLINKKRR